jgi:23S rRNA (pseudouridine1915-N3)-methyltransferase
VKLKVLTIGRMKKGPEAELIADYKARFDGAAPGLGFGKIEIQELELKKRVAGKERKRLEGELLLSEIISGALVIALDERGKSLRSRAFATLLADKRDEGVPELVLIIGGADGLSEAVRDRASQLLSFSPMTWPHMLVRVMVLEQLYRGASILAGHPYHRE